ncbi:MAG: methyltransferase domain-containing protein [Hyphomonadaceae bacterium]|nr:MAG: type 11 methyltransferase [Caulobacteraceae bacterium]MBT9447792.1 methyltransferase domain-containing protein [Hyphomonadaceae bacterium]TPW04979.1 MAG: type 11 methyltransferase [Alphaproteobacteria bacterium]
MRVDVLALQRFYASSLGAAARAAAAGRMETLWPGCAGLDVLGLGYAGPLIEPWRGTARRVISFMPAEQGAERWPETGPSAVVLGDELRLPFADAVFDRVILVHALEEAAAPQQFLREVWRVMAPEGRIVVIAANRAGLWALGDATPFGHGRPFSRRQLGRLMADAMFEPTASAVALHAPPWSWTAPLADGLERAGRLLRSPFGGIVMMEAVKRLYAATAKEGREVLLAKAPAHAAPHLHKTDASD